MQNESQAFKPDAPSGQTYKTGDQIAFIAEFKDDTAADLKVRARLNAASSDGSGRSMWFDIAENQRLDNRHIRVSGQIPVGQQPADYTVTQIFLDTQQYGEIPMKDPDGDARVTIQQGPIPGANLSDFDVAH